MGRWPERSARMAGGVFAWMVVSELRLRLLSSVRIGHRRCGANSDRVGMAAADCGGLGRGCSHCSNASRT